MPYTNARRIRAIWRFGKKYLHLFVVAEICILVSYGVSLLLPLNLTRLTDRVLTGGEYDLLPQVLLTYGVLFAVAVVFNLLYAYIWQTLQNRYILDVRKKMFRRVMYAKASFLSGMNSGDIMSRIDWDCNEFLSVVQRNVFHFVNSILLCAGIIAVVAGMHPLIAVILVIGALLPIVLTRLCGRLTEKYVRESRTVGGVFAGRLFEILKGFREIRLLCAEKWATSQVTAPLRKLIDLGNRTRRVDFVVDKGIYLVNLLVSLTIYGLSAYTIVRGELSIGMFLAIIEYVGLLHKKFNWMLRIYLEWFGKKASIDRVLEVLDCETEKRDGLPIGEIGSVEFRNVVFGYGDTPVLKGVSFRVGRGERVAIVGASGVGKTTMMGLLMRFYDPDSGQILFDGLPAQSLRLSDLRGQIGVVSQDIQLFDETVRYNLLLGEEYSEDQCWAALERAGIREVIQALPQGLDTRISSDTQGLSGGQKQRLMIARMLLKKVSVLVLDEATSALDVESESRIIRELDGIGRDITILVISHRAAAVRHCDRTIVMDGGRVESIGSHRELLERSPVYRQLMGGKAV